MGLGHFLEGAAKAVGNVAKAGAYVANPTHLDDIAKGVGKTAEFVVENPGKTANIAGQVGKAIIKDQLDPKNLAINAALIGATALTGGAAAPALAAKIGLGTKSLQAGVTAAKGADVALDAAKAVKTGAKVADTISDVSKTASTLSKVGRAADKALGAEKTASKLDKLRVVSKARGSLGQKILQGGAEGAPSLARQATSAAVTGTGRLAPTQAAGMSDKVYNAQKNVWRVQRAQKKLNQTSAANKGVEVAADPMGAVQDQAMKQIDAGGRTAGYVDRGQTSESLYGNSGGGGQAGGMYSRGDRPSPLALPAAGQTGWSGASGAASPNQAVSPYAGTGGTSSTRAQAFAQSTGQAPAGAAGPSMGNVPGTPVGGTGTSFQKVAGASGGQPPSGGPPTANNSNSNQGSPPVRNTSRTSTRNSGGGLSAADVAAAEWRFQQGGSGRGMHLWEGPRSQPYGGIKSSYDWRPVDPLRPITVPGRGSSSSDSSPGRRGRPEKSTQDSGQGGDGGGDQGAFGAPETFSPEVPKSGMYAISQGQQPAGSLMYPNMTEGGPQSRSTSRMYPTVGNPIGALPAGPKGIGPGNDIIDVDSHSDMDFGFDNKGQGFFDFSEMGTANVGQQRNVGPSLQTGSRTSRRGTLG